MSAQGSRRWCQAWPPRAGDGERGAATVLVLGMAGLLCFVGVALAAVAGVVAAHRTAQSAADLAALAAAAALSEGDDPCAAAGVVASANGASLTSCVERGKEARVEVQVAGPRWIGRQLDVEAEARAGPR